MALADTDETTQVEIEQPETQVEGTTTTETGDQPAGATGAEDGAADGAADEVVVTIEGESPTPQEEEEQRAPEWVRELRKSNREKDRRLRELEQQLAAKSSTGNQPAAIVVGDEPTFESCNFVEADFKREWNAWNQRKQEHATQEAKKAEAQQKQNEAWQATLQDYDKEKSSLKVRDYDEAEDAVRGVLSDAQRGILLHAIDKGRRAVVVYALGKNPKKAQELAAIEDPIKFTAALTKFEGKLNVTTTKKPATQPEKRVASTVAGAAAVDNTLEKLRAEAAKTGDLSKVLAYKAQLKAGRK